MKALLPRIDQVIRRHKKDWVRNGNDVTVDMKRTGRAQKVELVRTDDR